jgi:chemotaxis protein MotB
MNKKKDKKGKNKQRGAPHWMVTYSDMVTLLLTFFVLMMSMASMDKIKFEKAIQSLRGAFGVIQAQQNRQDLSYDFVKFTPIPHEMVQRVYKRIQQRIKSLKINKDIEVVKDRGAVILRVNNAVLFASGSLQLQQEAKKVLEDVAELIRPLPLNLRIEGHTDDTPIHTQGMTNWDLSAERALSVVKYFAKNNLFPLNRMAAVGYGDQHPIVPNTSAQNKALNRRVEFVLESIGSYQKELPYLIDVQDQYPF